MGVLIDWEYNSLLPVLEGKYFWLFMGFNNVVTNQMSIPKVVEGGIRA